MDEQTKHALDTALGVSAVTSVWWLQWIQTTIGFFMLIGGAFLLALRLAIAWREWRNGK